jgi:hypothetical protein
MRKHRREFNSIFAIIKPPFVRRLTAGGVGIQTSAGAGRAAPASNWRQDAAFTGTLGTRRHPVEAGILPASEGGFQPRDQVPWCSYPDAPVLGFPAS